MVILWLVCIGLLLLLRRREAGARKGEGAGAPER
jgi:hypothetical protein